MDDELKSALDIAGAVLIEGPRGCGKTATARRHAASEVLLDTEDNALTLARVDPSSVLPGATPRLIDEWQIEPRIWNHVRRTIDDRQQKGQFILTGSASPSDDVTRHSGAGRILRLRMRPLSFSEMALSGAEVSLSDILHEGEIPARTGNVELSVPELAEAICKGGWPGMRDMRTAQAIRLLSSYLDDVARVDIPELEGESRRDPRRIRRVLNSLARHSATEVADTVIAADAGDSDAPLRSETVAEYIDLLERIFIVERQPSWGPHLRSRDITRKKSKLHFVDPALASAGLGASPERLLADLKSFGLLYESLVIRDLRIYSQRLGATVSHYRDSAGTEVDAIVSLPDGRWIAAEVKLGTHQIDAAAASLHRFAQKLDREKTPPPSALVIITTGNIAYQRPNDDVIVVPLTMLGM